MKLRAIAVILTATSFLAINTAFTGDCDIKHSEMISKLKESSEYINDADRENILPLLEEALKLCKEGKVEEGQEIEVFVESIDSSVSSAAARRRA